MEEKITRLGTLNTHSFSAHLDRVKLKTGRNTERLWIDYPEAVAIVPFLSENEIILVRQWRYAAGKETLEIPAGKMNYDESPDKAANRELLEETGYIANVLEPLVTYFPAYGYSNEVINLFVGKNLEKKGDLSAIDEISQIQIVTPKNLFELVLQGKIMDAKTIIAAALLQTGPKIP